MCGFCYRGTESVERAELLNQMDVVSKGVLARGVEVGANAGLNENIASVVEPVQVFLHLRKGVFGMEFTASEIAEIQERTESANHFRRNKVRNRRKEHLWEISELIDERSDGNAPSLALLSHHPSTG